MRVEKVRCCVVVALIDYDGSEGPELLWTLRQDGKGWVLPGGLIERGETPSQAARRELKEETGILIYPTEEVPFTSLITEDGGEENITYLYEVDNDEFIEHTGVPIPNKEVAAIYWGTTPPDDGPFSDLALMHQAIARLVLGSEAAD